MEPFLFFGCHHQEKIILKDHYIKPEGDNFYKILLAKGEFNGFLNFSKVLKNRI